MRRKEDCGAPGTRPISRVGETSGTPESTRALQRDAYNAQSVHTSIQLTRHPGVPDVLGTADFWAEVFFPDSRGMYASSTQEQPRQDPLSFIILRKRKGVPRDSKYGCSKLWSHHGFVRGLPFPGDSKSNWMPSWGGCK